MRRFYRNIYEPSEVLALSPAQRRFVYRTYVHPITARMPVGLAKTVLLAAVIFLGWHLRAFASFAGLALVLIVAIALDECFRVFLLWRNKDKIAAIVREHAAEIASAEPGGCLECRSQASPWQFGHQGKTALGELKYSRATTFTRAAENWRPWCPTRPG